MKLPASFSLPAILIESFLVVFGVVAAFMANEWREQRRDQARATDALASIEDELRTNQAAVQSTVDYHGRLLGQLHQLSRTDPQATPAITVFERGFVSPATVLSTAWESARSTGALRHLPYAEVLRLSSVYAEQDNYLLQQRSVGEVLYRRLLHSGTDGLLQDYRHLMVLIGSFHYREQELLATYQRTLPAPPEAPGSTADSSPTEAP